MDRVISEIHPGQLDRRSAGFLGDRVDQAGARQYLVARRLPMGPIGDAEFFDDPLNAADSIRP